MSPGNDSRREGAVRAQEAIVRALAEELSHLDPASVAAACLRTQLVEESGRLAFRVDRARGSGLSEPPVEDSRAAEKRSRVLVVEDDDGTRTALARWLSSNYDVATARDGQEGFAFAIASRPDVIVTDFWMPRGDGISMVHRLRRIEVLATIPVIFLTGQTVAEIAGTGLSEQAFAYLAKPIDLDALEEALRASLSPPTTTLL